MNREHNQPMLWLTPFPTLWLQLCRSVTRARVRMVVHQIQKPAGIHLHFELRFGRQVRWAETTARMSFAHVKNSLHGTDAVLEAFDAAKRGRHLFLHQLLRRRQTLADLEALSKL